MNENPLPNLKNEKDEDREELIGWEIHCDLDFFNKIIAYYDLQSLKA